MSNPIMQNTKTAAMERIAALNAVEGFDPVLLAVEYTDQNGGTSSKRLPVMAQLAWFRLRYPDGRIAVSVKPENSGYAARVRVFKDYKDTPEQFLAEAEAFRTYNAEKPTVSPREWAQTAAVGIALRNAGFGLQFSAAGDSFDWSVTDELGAPPATDRVAAGFYATAVPSNPPEQNAVAPQAQANTPQPTPPEVTAPAPARTESPLEAAMKMPCPISKYNGKCLGDLIMLDPDALAYIARSVKYNPEIVAGAVLICQHALQQAS